MVATENPVSQRIVQAAATITDVDPLELPPLFEAVDPDALDALCEGMADGVVSFRYAGCAVTVDSRGVVDVQELPSAESGTREAVSGD